MGTSVLSLFTMKYINSHVIPVSFSFHNFAAFWTAFWHSGSTGAPLGFFPRRMN
jgi:hypothetical protein